MFNLGFSELILLAVVGLLVLGPKQLPQVAKVLGKLAGEVKKAIADVSSEVERASESVKQEGEKIHKDINDGILAPNPNALKEPSKDDDGRA